MRLQAAQSALSALRLGLLVSSAPPQRAAIRLSDAFVDKLPAPNEVPPNGVEYTSRLSKEMTEHSWLLHWNHFINLQFFNDNVLSGIPGTMCPQIAYPVRMTESAGYRRVFNLRGGPERRMVGDQTILNLMRSEEDGASLVGSLVPVTSAALAALDTTFAGLHREVVHFEHFEWLAWMDPPADLTEVIVFRPGPMSQAAAGPPTFELPMVQSYVDDALKGALQYGDEFAAEWLDTTYGWSRYWLNDRLESRRPWVHTPQALRIDSLLDSHPPAASGRNMFEWRAHVVEYPALNPALTPPGVTLPSPGQRRAAAARVDTSGSDSGVADAQDVLPPNASPASASASADARASGSDEALEAPNATDIVLSDHQCAGRRTARNFLIGFGSIIQTESRRSSDPDAVDAAPCRIKRDFGYVREWNFQAATAQICALGLRRVRPGEVGATINGVIFPAADDLTAFDARENGYQRVEVPRQMVELLSWQTLPTDAKIFVYVPYAPRVVDKYGRDPQTGLPRCSGPDPPDELDEATEGAGRGLLPPSAEYPILQTYVDVVISGCLEHGDDFAREFIETTFLWAPYWLNERTLARRPWVHQKQYVKIDQLLREHVPAYYARRRLESEYATLLVEDESV